MKLKFFLMLGITFLSINIHAQTYKTVCEPDVHENAAVFGGAATCTGSIVYPPFTTKPPPGWPVMRTLSKDFPDSDVPAIYVGNGNWFYSSPPAVRLQTTFFDSCTSIISATCDLDKGSCTPAMPSNSCGGIAVTYSCNIAPPFKTVPKIVKKGVCHQEIVTGGTLVTEVVNLRATAPGCTTSSNGGYAGPGSSVSVNKVTCPTDTIIYVLNKTWSSGLTTCTVASGTAGYAVNSVNSTCDSFKLNKM